MAKKNKKEIVQVEDEVVVEETVSGEEMPQLHLVPDKTPEQIAAEEANQVAANIANYLQQTGYKLSVKQTIVLEKN